MDFHRSLMFLILYLSFSLLVCFNVPIDGRSTTLSTIGEQQLMRKKPVEPLKTIKTRHGDIIDCVDIYKQPAFDHHLLKNHKIQMNPNFSHTRVVQSATSLSNITIRLIGKGCPSGTVPIRRVPKEELTTAQTSFREQFLNFSLQSFDEQPKLLFAGYSTKTGTGPYYGAGGSVGIYNPKVAPGQLSGSVLSIEGGPPEQFSTIRVGWIVNINKFGDSRTRLYSIWGQATNGVMHGCYNIDCPGFIQIDKTIPLGIVFEPVSVPGGTEYYINLQVRQDRTSKNWWLIYANSTQIGYWPSSLFTNLNEGASILRWGGQVATSAAQLPPMGNGKADDYGCLYMDIELNPAVAPIEKLETGCYKVGDLYKKDDNYGYRFWFGGNGGDVQHCS